MDISGVNKPFKFADRIRSFSHAIRGIYRMIQGQHNAWIHVSATGIVLVSGFLLNISAQDWCWVILSISLVWTAEAFNTALEFLSDLVSTEFHPLIRDAKDAAAGAVLIAAITSAIIGSITFWPHVEKLRNP